MSPAGRRLPARFRRISPVFAAAAGSAGSRSVPRSAAPRNPCAGPRTRDPADRPDCAISCIACLACALPPPAPRRAPPPPRRATPMRSRICARIRSYRPRALLLASRKSATRTAALFACSSFSARRSLKPSKRWSSASHSRTPGLVAKPPNAPPGRCAVTEAGKVAAAANATMPNAKTGLRCRMRLMTGISWLTGVTLADRTANAAHRLVPEGQSGIAKR